MNVNLRAMPLITRAFTFFTVLLFTQCSEEHLLLTSTSTLTTSTTAGTTTLTTDGACGCTYTVPANAYRVDGIALGIKPGAVICLKAGVSYYNIVFSNLRGTASSPITIKNCGGTAILKATGRGFGLKTQYSSFLRITGGTAVGVYGIRVTGGHQSVHLGDLSSDVELDHVEVGYSGFAGIMAKTDPTCDTATHRGNFVMRNVILHDNYVHDTAGEGLYVGHTFFVKGANTNCGVRLPHVVEGVKIYNNLIKNSGWESIQIGSTPKGAEVYNNRIENYGAKDSKYQNNGVQFGEGAPGKFYGNYIKGGKGIGLMILGNADVLVHDNVIINTGSHGIFCDERTAVGPGFTFLNNTIVNPGGDGIRIYAETVPMNIIYNNIIVNPKSYSTYQYPRTGNDAYVYLLAKTVPVKILNNLFTRDVNAPKFVSPSTYNYKLGSASPLINKGTSIAVYNILLDHALTARLKGIQYDMGAYEY